MRHLRLVVAPVTHDIFVTYTIDDDGVHLWCATCKRDLLVEFTPGLDELNAAAAKHNRETP